MAAAGARARLPRGKRGEGGRGRTSALVVGERDEQRVVARHGAIAERGPRSGAALNLVLLQKLSSSVHKRTVPRSQPADPPFFSAALLACSAHPSSPALSRTLERATVLAGLADSKQHPPLRLRPPSRLVPLAPLGNTPTRLLNLSSSLSPTKRPTRSAAPATPSP
ncbi:hypothetical protein BJY59DRAFT_311069 [Rhodotorula toruloides]